MKNMLTIAAVLFLVLSANGADRAGRVMQPLVVTVDLAAQGPQGAAVFVTRD